MSVEQKTAKHICSIVSRQIKTGFPELTIEYIVHAENKREETFYKSLDNIKNHVAGEILSGYPDLVEKQKILQKNKSRFTILGKHEKSRFLGLFKSRAYIGISFINHDRFRSPEDLRNHALNLAWHAIELYLDVIRTPKPGDVISFIEQHGAIIPNLDDTQRAYRNLIADIFAATVQRLQGRKNAFEMVVTQRIFDTLTPQPDFEAEFFPSPVCADTFDFAFRNCERNNNMKNDLFVKAANITQDISAAFDLTTIEHWHNFAVPAQYMAWTGSSPETILGAALYTAENIHTQSISDMIAERMALRAELLSIVDSHNPFAHPETNEKVHQKKCAKIRDQIFYKIQNQENVKLLLDEAKQQNKMLFANNVSGWCADILVKVHDAFKENLKTMSFYESRREAIKMMDHEIKNSNFQPLINLSERMFKKIRKGYDITPDRLQRLIAEVADADHIAQTLLRIDEASFLTEDDEYDDKIINETDNILPNQINISQIMQETTK